MVICIENYAPWQTYKTSQVYFVGKGCPCYSIIMHLSNVN